MEEKSHKIKVLNIGDGYALDCDGFQQLAFDKSELVKQIGTDVFDEQENGNFIENYGFEIEYTINPITRSPF